MEQLHKLMMDLSKQHGEDKTSNFITDLFTNNKTPVALLINERYVNIPPPISVPLLQSIRYKLLNKNNILYSTIDDKKIICE